MADNGNIVARRSSKSSTVTNFFLDVRDDSSFRDGAEREDISDRKVGVLAGVDELTSVHALVRDEGFGVKLESVGIAEDNLCERSSSARIVDDCTNQSQNLLHGGRRMPSKASNPGLLTLLHNASNVTMSLSFRISALVFSSTQLMGLPSVGLESHTCSCQCPAT